MSNNIQATQTPMDAAREAAHEYLYNQYSDCTPEMLNVYHHQMMSIMTSAAASKTWAELPEDHRVGLCDFMTILSGTVQACAILYYDDVSDSDYDQE